ncbi:hypothetical protein [Cellulosimicrobium sp. TH-20]|uniref:hypothetical protein n=1 Tax=Cellulosimicrobium sp. TH-20 TaxID=1980001 RepID=UPI00119E6F19|nr:hypothetical protein [Cellulosimicrobium sp. TH-20]
MTDTTTEAVAPEALEPVKLKPEVKAAWLAALRSGEYPQASGVLERIDHTGVSRGFCCLGVLCKLAADTGAAERDVPGAWAGSTVRYRVEGGSSSPYMPVPEIAAWAFDGDVSRADAWLVPTPGDIKARYDEATVALSTLNDSFGYTFEQLADLIEQHL